MIFEIPENNLEYLKRHIDKLQKKALKVGAPEIIFNIGQARSETWDIYSMRKMITSAHRNLEA
jgi:hypothetical protein